MTAHEFFHKRQSAVTATWRFVGPGRAPTRYDHTWWTITARGRGLRGKTCAVKTCDGQTDSLPRRTRFHGVARQRAVVAAGGPERVFRVHGAAVPDPDHYPLPGRGPILSTPPPRAPGADMASSKRGAEGVK